MRRDLKTGEERKTKGAKRSNGEDGEYRAVKILVIQTLENRWEEQIDMP